MVKAIFIDFYGTVVFEDGENVSRISNRIFETGKAESVSQVSSYWWNVFKTLFENSYVIVIDKWIIFPQFSDIHVFYRCSYKQDG